MSDQPAADNNATETQPMTEQPITGQPMTGQPPKPKKSKAARRKRRGKVIKTIVGLFVALIIVGAIVYGMYWLFTREKPVSYLHEPVYRSMLETAVQGWGYIRPVESADIAVLAKSKVKESFYFAGDMVFEGDLLFTLESDDLDKQIDAIHVQIAEIQAKIDKANDDIAVLSGDEAERQVNLVVKVPFNGQLIEAARFKAGDYVTIGDIVGTMVDDRNLILSLYFSYAYEGIIKVGQSAEISIPATMAVVNGTVSQINMVRRISPEGTTLFEVVIALKNPGTLTAEMEAGAVIRSEAEDIFPSENGKLEYSRKEPILVKAPGKLTYANLISYMDYSAGDTLCRIEYIEDNSQVEVLKQQIKLHEDEISVLEHNIEVASEGYNNLNVIAPMSGTIMYNNLIPGATVEPGLAVISIAKLDKMIVESQVDERQVGQVRVGMPVDIGVWSMDGQMILPGTVKSVSLTPAESMNYGGSVVYYPAVFEIENFSGQLMNGQNVDYRLVVEQKFDILVAPVIAVKNTELGTCVFVMADERPENAVDLAEGIVPPGFYAVPVECGIGNQNGIEIISGIEEGAEVFTQIIPLDEGDKGGGGMYYYG